MKDTFTFYAWRLSWYSAKARSYLQHKGILFVEKKPSLYTLRHTIARRCGDGAVPVLVTPEGEWIQNSLTIIEQMELRFGGQPVLPASPVQRFFSGLVEIWADEFWHPTAEHYRFSFPENMPAWREELSTMLPGFPGVAQNLVVEKAYRGMKNVTHDVGVVPENIKLIEQWSEQQLDALDRHFADMPYLLGGHATLGDFSLMGPIFGHLAWDQYPRKNLIAPRKHLSAWIERMSDRPSQKGELLAEDRIPESLQPMLSSIVKELIPYMECCAQDLASTPHISASDKRYQRMGKSVEVPFGGGSLRRVVTSYTLWMLQRILDMPKRMSVADRSMLHDWLASINAEHILDIEFPRVRRIGIHIADEIS